MRLPTPRESSQRGFTLVELLVVIGIIAVLISVLLPALNKARAQAQITACMSNIKQLTTAWVMYANENRGYLPCAETSPGGKYRVDPGGVPKDVIQFDGWVIDVDGDPDVGTEASVRAGALWKYAPAPNVYRCPASTDDDTYRSYSLSTHLNGSAQYEVLAVPRKKITQVKSDILVFIEENSDQVDPTTGRRVNKGSFLQWRNADTRWGDPVALFHKKGTVMSFADTHAEYRQWQDRRTLTTPKLRDAWHRNPNNADLAKLKVDIYGTKLLYE